ncbi:MAG: protein kinase domain-containing protein [Betaproteobacteria bacterium]
MNPSTWQRMKPLVAEAAEHPASEREHFVTERCSDPELRREILELLASPARLSAIVSAPALGPGFHLDPYRIEELIGRGGMGDVYRARDTRLDREVAIKVLPTEFANDPDRRARFEREARAVAALNHPNIVTLYEPGINEAGPYLVLEKIEGRTLGELLRSGPLPVRRLVALAAQIADGLAKAHAAGIVHRDLKPDNVMVTDDGIAKILDFGLAKIVWSEFDVARVEQDATLARDTASGMIPGTVGYLSPEQAAGRPADFRADQFALGALLYEMATGARPFRRATMAESLVATIREEPDALQSKRADLPLPFSWIVERCLAKDPDNRYASTRDLARDLADLRDRLSDIGTGPREALAGPSVPSPRERLVWIAACAALLGALVWIVTSVRAPSGIARRFELSVLPPAGLAIDSDAGSALSPDGQSIVFGAGNDVEGTSLWLRKLGEAAPRKLPGTGGAIYPFFAPDSRTVGFFRDGKLQLLGLDEAEPRAICDAPEARGGSWGSDGTILFGALNRPLQRVPAAGGVPKPATALDPDRKENDHRWPWFLPDGRHFLYTASLTESGDGLPLRLFVASLDGGAPHALFDVSSTVAYVAPGYLFFLRPDRTLMAQAFDARSLALQGEPRPLAEHVMLTSQRWNAQFAVSTEGTLMFQAGPAGVPSRLVWRDRSGRALDTLASGGDLDEPRISPDGRSVVASMADPDRGNYDLWIFGTDRRTATRMTRGPSDSDSAIWSPDGRTLYYRTYAHPTVSDLFRVDAASGAAPELLLAGKSEKVPVSVAPGNEALLFQQRKASGVSNLWLLDLVGHGAKPLRDVSFADAQAAFSPDGRWIAFSSAESGRWQVYLEAYPSRGRPIQVSPEGGYQPRWSRRGKEILYLDLEDNVQSVAFTAEPAPRLGAPARLFHKEGLFGHGPFDVSADGERLLFAEADAAAPRPPLTVRVPYLPKKLP